MSVSLGSTVWAQQLGAGRIVITPGDMVSDGLGRALSAVRSPFEAPRITETPESITDFDEPEVVIDTDQLLADAVRQFTVNAIAQFFAVIANDFLTRMGLPALFSTDFLSNMPEIVFPDLSGGDGGADPQGSGDPEVPGGGTADPPPSGGGRNGGRPRG